MICLPARLPLIQVGTCEVAHYGPRWIEGSIERAAREAGHETWIFAEDVAQGVIQYLRDLFPGSSIALADLFERIGATLRAIGFHDVAEHLRVEPPPVEISLSEIARRAAPGFDLLFFRLLDERIAQLRTDGVSSVRFTGLEASSRILRPGVSEATSLTREIVAFLSHRTSGDRGFRAAPDDEAPGDSLRMTLAGPA